MCYFCDKAKETKELRENTPDNKYYEGVNLVSGQYTHVVLYYRKNEGYCISGIGDDETDLMYVPFCPQCGKKLE